jgi:hypothetical protein
MCGGFFYSDDLAHWEFHQNTLDMYRYAPDVHVINGSMVFCASTRGKASTFWKTEDPLSDKFEKISEPFDFWDPATFQDDDGRVYLYWGCDCNQPIFCQELDPDTMMPIGKRMHAILPDAAHHGWERPRYPWAPKKKPSMFDIMMKLSGRDGDKYPYFEGAFMSKFGNKYYLQYAAPGTELIGYGNGVHVGDNPEGPFTYQTHNPFSLKTGGFAKGAGHGSTIEDRYGNLWHVATMTIAQNANFERRCGLFPAGVDEDGILFCNQNFADYPLDIPDGRFDPNSVSPKWMLLSYKKPVTVSSVYKEYAAEQAVNEDIKNCWCADGSQGEWITVDLGKVYPVGAIQINFANVEVPIKKVDKSLRSDVTTGNRYIDLDRMQTRWILEGSRDGDTWEMLCDKSKADTNLCDDFVELEIPTELRYVRLTSVALPYDQRLAVNGLRIFGKDHGQLPEAVTQIKAERIYDAMSCQVTWKPVKDALGYNVRYGIAPDKLYLSHMLYADEGCEVKLGTLNQGIESYYFAVDSFNASGITKGEVIAELK